MKVRPLGEAQVREV